MPRILERWLRGWNEIVEAPHDVAAQAGVSIFRDVVHHLHLSVDELSGALKIPIRDLNELYNSNGYISGDARNNLLGYAGAKNALDEYLLRQHGPAEKCERTAL